MRLVRINSGRILCFSMKQHDYHDKLYFGEWKEASTQTESIVWPLYDTKRDESEAERRERVLKNLDDVKQSGLLEYVNVHATLGDAGVRKVRWMGKRDVYTG